MTKTKMSTVAIVTLSVLLAAALAATIVLAAFSFSRSATTTITFAGGLTLTATAGITDGAWNAKTLSSDGTIGTAAATSNQTSGITFDKISLKNDSTDKDVLVAVAVIVTSSAGSDAGAVAPTLYVSDGASNKVTATTELKDSAETTAVNINFCGVATATKTTPTDTAISTAKSWAQFTIAAGQTANDVVKYINTKYAAADIVNFTGASITATFYVAAAYDQAGLTEAIKTGTFASFTTGA